MKKLLCASLLLVSPWGVADQLEALKSCVPVVDHIERLQCYDQEMRNIAKQSAVTPSDMMVDESVVGEWVIKQQQDEEGKITLSASVKVDSARSQAPGKVNLSITCHTDKPTTLGIYWLTFLGRDIYVTAHEEGVKGKRLNWNLDAKETTTVYPKQANSLIHDLYDMDSFVAQVETRSDGLMIAKFNVAGLEASLLPYQSLCNL